MKRILFLFLLICLCFCGVQAAFAADDLVVQANCAGKPELTLEGNVCTINLNDDYDVIRVETTTQYNTLQILANGICSIKTLKFDDPASPQNVLLKTADSDGPNMLGIANQLDLGTKKLTFEGEAFSLGTSDSPINGYAIAETFSFLYGTPDSIIVNATSGLANTNWTQINFESVLLAVKDVTEGASTYKSIIGTSIPQEKQIDKQIPPAYTGYDISAYKAELIPGIKDVVPSDVNYNNGFTPANPINGTTDVTITLNKADGIDSITYYGNNKVSNSSFKIEGGYTIPYKVIYNWEVPAAETSWTAPEIPNEYIYADEFNYVKIFGPATEISDRQFHTFKEWGDAPSAATVKYQPENTYPLSNDTPLYAVWEENKLTVPAYCETLSADGTTCIVTIDKDYTKVDASTVVPANGWSKLQLIYSGNRVVKDLILNGIVSGTTLTPAAEGDKLTLSNPVDLQGKELIIDGGNIVSEAANVAFTNGTLSGISESIVSTKSDVYDTNVTTKFKNYIETRKNSGGSNVYPFVLEEQTGYSATSEDDFYTDLITQNPDVTITALYEKKDDGAKAIVIPGVYDVHLTVTGNDTSEMKYFDADGNVINGISEIKILFPNGYTVIDGEKPTETPVPTETETPVPTETETPVPTETETPVPTETETPQPILEDLSVPGSCTGDDSRYIRLGDVCKVMIEKDYDKVSISDPEGWSHLKIFYSGARTIDSLEFSSLISDIAIAPKDLDDKAILQSKAAGDSLTINKQVDLKGKNLDLTGAVLVSNAVPAAFINGKLSGTPVSVVSTKSSLGATKAFIDALQIENPADGTTQVYPFVVMSQEVKPGQPVKFDTASLPVIPGITYSAKCIKSFTDPMLYDVELTITADNNVDLTLFGSAGIPLKNGKTITYTFSKLVKVFPPKPQPFPWGGFIIFDELFDGPEGPCCMPGTGFPTTSIRADIAGANLPGIGYELQIPVLDVNTVIVSIPRDGNSWDVSGLGKEAGLLEDSPLPGEGPAIIAGHNHLDMVETGPFLFIGDLEEGDSIFVRTPEGELQRYAVYANKQLLPDDIDTLTQTAGLYENSLTLLTCEDETPDGSYRYRRVVFAQPL